MKLFLCGGGCGSQITLANNKFAKLLDRSKPILYIPLAMEERKYNGCKEWFSEEIKNFGGNRFEMVRSSKELSEKDFNNYSALFIGGGNTFKLLSEIKQNGNYEKIINYLNNDGVIFGGSAGAIIFGEDINSCLIDDGNKVGLENTKGFNFLKDYSLLCHLKNKNFNKNLEHLSEYSKNRKMIYLAEESVIYINNNKISLIGDNKYVVFKDGKYYIHKPANFKKDMK